MSRYEMNKSIYRNIINDGSKRLPKLHVQQSWWAMTGLGGPSKEWSFDEKFERIAEAGFSGIFGFLPANHEADLWRKKLDEYQLSFGILLPTQDPEDLPPILSFAKDFGVDYISTQIFYPFKTGKEAVNILQRHIITAQNIGIPYFVETHRGRITQDLLRTVDYVHAIDDLRLTIDLSHYIVTAEVVAGENPDYMDQMDSLFNELFPRASSIHGRVSNGHQVQVDIGRNGDHPMVEHFSRWWGKSMNAWLTEAKQGDIFPFVCELGPPFYSITKPSHSGEFIDEISDRWEQSLLFKRIAENSWNSVSHYHYLRRSCNDK